MDFELKLEKPALSRGWISALVMGISYFLGTSSSFLLHYQHLFSYDPFLFGHLLTRIRRPHPNDSLLCR
jgi:hypothetical protein